MSAEDVRVAILASGNRETGGGGSTAERFTRDTLEGKVSFTVGVVVCNNPEGSVGVYDLFNDINSDFGLTGDRKIDVVNISSSTHPGGRQERGQTLAESAAICRLMEERAIGFTAMLGYLKKINGEYLETWCWQPEYGTAPGFEYRNGLYHPGSKTSNNHPQILPFTADTHGPGAHQEAMDLYGADKLRSSAMTWHLAAEKIDGGPIIAELAVPIYLDDTAETLGDRVQKVEKDKTALVIENHLILRSEHLRAA